MFRANPTVSRKRRVCDVANVPKVDSAGPRKWSIFPASRSRLGAPRKVSRRLSLSSHFYCKIKTHFATGAEVSAETGWKLNIYIRARASITICDTLDTLCDGLIFHAGSNEISVLLLLCYFRERINSIVLLKNLLGLVFLFQYSCTK
jgi:hypothetical protein